MNTFLISIIRNNQNPYGEVQITNPVWKKLTVPEVLRGILSLHVNNMALP
jgi:hypothetical protein